MTMPSKDLLSAAGAAVAALLCLARSPAPIRAFSSTTLPPSRTTPPRGRQRLIAFPLLVESGEGAIGRAVEDPSPPPLVVKGTAASAGAAREAGEEARGAVPRTWEQALRRFFVGDLGPPLVVLSISGFVFARAQLPTPFSVIEGSVVTLAVVFWWVQEYLLHRVLLHSPFDWMGKSIHEAHHSRGYFHVSIDPPELLLGWLLAAHLLLRWALPRHLCLSATVGYALAGLAYEWSHYIVHTRVRPTSSGDVLSRLFARMRENHMRHHLLDDHYWFAFSVPAMDDLLGTNPDVREARGSKEGDADTSR